MLADDELSVTVHQGFVEESNVDLAEEMTRMIRAQRAYQLAARAVATADQMMQVANAIRS
jgi:flagellar basal-body rod protein FlgG